MEGLGRLNLIRFFDFYLAIAFLASTLMRLRQYHSLLQLIRAVPSRWPNLFKLIRGEHHVFLTWSTLGPALLALLLTIIQLIASRFVWPQAGQSPDGLTIASLAARPLVIPLLAVLGLAMLSFDAWGILSARDIPRRELEPCLDQAEYWLRSWAAPVVHVVTFGKINPRQRVSAEVRAALATVSQLVNYTLWWVSAQLGLRITFGLALWLTYAFGAS